MQISGSPTPQSSQQPSQVELKMLKKSQDMAEQQAQALVQSIPKNASASPPGVGTNINMTA